MTDANTHKHLHTPHIPPGLPTTALRTNLTARVTYTVCYSRLISHRQTPEAILCFEISIAVIFIREVFWTAAETALLLNSCRMRWQEDGGLKNTSRARKEKWRQLENDKSFENDLCWEYTHTQARVRTHTPPVSERWPLGVTAWGIPGAIKWEVRGAAESCGRMDVCHGRQGTKINSHERGCSHVYSSSTSGRMFTLGTLPQQIFIRKVSYIYSEDFVVLLKILKCPNVAQSSHLEKKNWWRRSTKSRSRPVLCETWGWTASPSYSLIHNSCSHLLHTYTVHTLWSHCTAHKLGQGVAATGVWELAQAQIVTVSVPRVGACLMVYCACVLRASHLSLSGEPHVCLLGVLAFSVPLITRENASMTHDSNLSPKFLCSGEAKQTFDVQRIGAQQGGSYISCTLSRFTYWNV